MPNCLLDGELANKILALFCFSFYSVISDCCVLYLISLNTFTYCVWVLCAHTWRFVIVFWFHLKWEKPVNFDEIWFWILFLSMGDDVIHLNKNKNLIHFTRSFHSHLYDDFWFYAFLRSQLCSFHRIKWSNLSFDCKFAFHFWCDYCLRQVHRHHYDFP